MRTNVNLTDDARKFAEYYAQANGITLGQAISALILKARDAKAEPDQIRFEMSEAGFPIFPSKDRVITTKMISVALEDLL